MVGLLGCVAAVFGTQAVVLGPICTGIGVADALYEDYETERVANFRADCITNKKICTNDEKYLRRLSVTKQLRQT